MTLCVSLQVLDVFMRVLTVPAHALAGSALHETLCDCRSRLIANETMKEGSVYVSNLLEKIQVHCFLVLVMIQIMACI